jgi:DNA helicase-4
MFFLLTILISIAAISLIAIVIIRIRLKEMNDELSELLNSSYNRTFVDIPTYIKYLFHDKVISENQQKELTVHYSSNFQEAISLVKKLNIFGITPAETISKFISDYDSIRKLVNQHNEVIMNQLLDTHKYFFDHCLKYPLDKQQRRSIVSEAENCLVVSSAGSGKTSSIVGKVKYLTEIKKTDPQRILLISYTNKAAAELTERMATDGLKGYTFHKLAIDIIAKATGVKPSICDNTDSLFVNIYQNLLEKKGFKKSIIQYFIDYQTNEADWEIHKNERREMLSEQKLDNLKQYFPIWMGKLSM